MNDTPQIRVRDSRKPGHCWQDNELYDVFQPIIGPMAMLVYLQMTRECYGHTVEFSLRELGTASGVSKDTAQRALGILELIGMVRRTRAGSVHVPAQYELTDLKELCRHYGGVMHRARASYILPPAEAGALRERVKEFLLRGREPKRSESTVSVGDSSEECNKTAHISARKDSIDEAPAIPTVSVGDSNPDVPGDGTVSQNGVYCLPGETPLYNKTQNSKTNPTPTPPLPGGEREVELSPSRILQLARASGELLSESAVEFGKSAAVDRVMRECGFSDPRLAPVIDLALSWEVVRSQTGVDEIAALMIQRWREYCQVGEYLRYTWSPKKFIAQGHWLNVEGWPLDQERLDRARGAAVGSYR